MPNRILRESIRSSESINELSWFEEVLFYRLIVSCDDFGRYDGRPAMVKAACFPLKDIRNCDVEKALNKLSAVGMVRLYEVDSRPYLQLTAWQRFQTPRAVKSKYPDPETGKLLEPYEVSEIEAPEEEDREDDDSLQTSANICMQVHADSPVFDIRESNTNIKDICASEAAPDTDLGPIGDTADKLFDDLWEAYPQKRGKGNVSATTKKKLLKVGRDEMFRALERYLRECDEEHRFLKNGSTFFNSGYVDYLDANYKPLGKQSGKQDKGEAMKGQHRDFDYDSFIASSLYGSG